MPTRYNPMAKPATRGSAGRTLTADPAASGTAPSGPAFGSYGGGPRRDVTTGWAGNNTMSQRIPFWKRLQDLGVKGTGDPAANRALLARSSLGRQPQLDMTRSLGGQGAGTIDPSSLISYTQRGTPGAGAADAAGAVGGGGIDAAIQGLRSQLQAPKGPAPAAPSPEAGWGAGAAGAGAAGGAGQPLDQIATEEPVNNFGFKMPAPLPPANPYTPLLRQRMNRQPMPAYGGGY